MSKRYPFKFLNAYDRADIDIFFGRDEEIDQLYQMVFQSNLLLVYGPSGAGKTSLINCGLASRFQSHDWLAINVRRGADLNASLREKLEAAAGEPVAAGLDVDWLEDDEEETAGPAPAPLSPLARQFKNIYLRHFRPIYLIFDQFEELFVLGDAEEQATFIQTVQEILKVDDPVKMIFSMREEYLGHLFEFERAVPQLLRKKLRIEPMHLDKVRQVILGAAGLQDKGLRTNIHLQPGEEEAIVREVFDKIKGGEKTLTIKLPYLQVFLDKLYLRLTGDQDRQAEATFTLAALAETGDIGDVLREFLEDEAQRIERELVKKYPGLPEDAVWRILSPFATLEGTKEPLSRSELQERLGSDFPEPVVRTALQELENHRILRHEEAGDLYEVAHDSLARRIADHRSDEEIALLEIRRLINSQAGLEEDARQFFSEKQINLIDPYLDKLTLDTEEKALIEASRQAVIEQRAAEQRRAEAEKERLLERQRLLERNQRTQRRFLGGMGVALVAMVLLAVWAFRQKQYTGEALDEADALNQKNERLIDALYFYDDQYALAVKQTSWGPQYGYIDKEGNTRIEFNYTEARPFEDIGFARVKGQFELYLIDTTGREYTLAESLEQLNSETEALDLRYKELTVLPDSILLFPQLKILLLSGNGLTSLPENIGELSQLEVLDLGYNSFSELPTSLGKLTQLKVLYLKNGYEMTQVPAFLPQLKNLRRLDLSFNQLEELPESFGKLRQLRSLDLGGNPSLELSESIGQLKELKDLHLYGIELRQLPSFVGELQQLRRLNLSKNKLDSLPTFVGQLQQLQGFHLDNNQLKELPESFGKLRQLEELDLTSNHLKELPQSFGELQNLKKLDLTSNHLKELPQSFGKLQQFKRLDLSDNHLKYLPESFGELDKLEELILRSDSLRQLPRSFAQLQNLRVLNLGDNQLKELPESLTKLKKLQELYLYNDSLTQLPASFAQLEQLRDLDLSNNQLKEVPQSLEKLQNLVSLDLSNNQLKEVPQSLEKLQNLRRLYLSNNQFKEVPQSLEKLQNLIVLFLNDNQLKELPESFAQLEQLRGLDLSNNQLKEVPQSLEKLQNLVSLDLSDNQLTQIPESLNQLQLLRSLFLSNNRIVQIPESLNQLRQLRRITFRDNPITQLPPNLQTWDSPTLIEALIGAWEHRLSDSLSIDRQRQHHFDLTKLYARLIDVYKESGYSSQRDLYQLSRHQLLSGQFAEAQTTVRRGLEKEPESPDFNRLLPPIQLLQGRYEAAKADYLRLKGEPLDPEYEEPTLYAEAFLEDLDELERLALIPKAYEKQVAEIRALLQGETR